MGQTRIEVGGEVFAGGEIRSGGCYLNNSLTADELSIDTLEATVQCSTEYLPLYASDGYAPLRASDGVLLARMHRESPVNYPRGGAVSCFHDGRLLGKFYLSGVKRTGRREYSMSCVSAIGLLENSKHYGGIYNGTPMGQVLADITGGLLEYTLDPEFRGLGIYGHLPIGTRRQNLHWLLFSTGASVRKEASGAVRFAALTADSPKQIGMDRLFTGGSVEEPDKIVGVAVTEHSYAALPSDETVTLYEGKTVAGALVSPKGAALTGALLELDGPVYGLEITGGTILEWGPNYAVLGPSVGCVLTGRRYSHITRVTAVDAKGTPAEPTDSMYRVDDVTLVSPLNAPNVARRVLAYYAAASRVQMDIVVGEERTGDLVETYNAFREPVTGFLQSLDIRLSGLLRAGTTLASGYTPTGIGNAYSRTVTLKGAGTFTVPEGCYQIRAALFQAGEYGGDGQAGEDGTQGTTSSSTNSYLLSPGKGGKGGAAGLAGRNGRVLEVELQVTPGQVLTYTAGDAAPHGQVGAHTVFGGYSSAAGEVPVSGWVDLLTGQVMSKPGIDGTPGGDGGDGGTSRAGSSDSHDGPVGGTGENGKPGGDVGTWKGGTGGTWTTDLAYYNDSGGGGGGAVDRRSGKNGANGADGGDGGDGAGVPITISWPPPKLGLGEAGNGGHGGGGGGGSGGRWSRRGASVPGPAGKGGTGGFGSEGGPGGVILYY